MTPQSYIEACRSAGELLERLQAALGFGELSMSFDREADMAHFRWSFTTSGQRYSWREVVCLHELYDLNSIEGFADCLAARIKRRSTSIATPIKTEQARGT